MRHENCLGFQFRLPIWWSHENSGPDLQRQTSFAVRPPLSPPFWSLLQAPKSLVRPHVCDMGSGCSTKGLLTSGTRTLLSGKLSTSAASVYHCYWSIGPQPHTTGSRCRTCRWLSILKMHLHGPCAQVQRTESSPSVRPIFHYSQAEKMSFNSATTVKRKAVKSYQVLNLASSQPCIIGIRFLPYTYC